MIRFYFFVFFLYSFYIISISGISNPSYNIGVGIADITGPVVEVNMMGYADPVQINSGLHLRLFSRAFVVQEIQNPSKIFAFVSIDQGMTSQIVKTEVSRKLSAKYGKDVYSDKNIMISATHTHSGPAGFFQYLLYVITSRGFIKQSYDAIVEGVFKSIVMAHESKAPGRIFMNEGHVYNSSINRSPISYLANPKEERDRYESNVDTAMTILKFVNENDSKPIGVFTWFPVHGVSMNESNTLISSDNKGLASIMFESEINGKATPLGKGPFVAAFAQANEGDVSPNTAGPKCIDTGEPCDNLGSVCGGRVEKCIAFGPGSNMFESTRLIAVRQYNEAKKLFDSANKELIGSLEFVHQNIDMTNRTVQFYENGKSIISTTCKQAMGYSFAAGTTDGPGAFDFRQGMTNGTELWNLVRDLIKNPSKELIKCQAPKAVLLAVGELEFPYQWVPSIVETQVFKIGPILIAGLPGEFTTMSGRRIRNAMLKIAKQSEDECEENINPKLRLKNCYQQNSEDYHVILAGLSNVYTDYIATYEEYQVQRYEAASTIFGPHTLQAYIDQFEFLTKSLINKEIVEPGPEPPFFLDKVYSLVPGVVFDSHPYGKPFGFVTRSPKSHYSADETVKVEFQAANPRNNMRLGDTYLTVEKKIGTESWQIFKTDANWETKLHWERRGFIEKILGRSYVIIDWQIKDINGLCEPGIYRIGHKGSSKNILGTITPYNGYTNEIIVTC